MTITGCFSVHLYCRYSEHCRPEGEPNECHRPRVGGKIEIEFTGRTETECLREARIAGWHVVRHQGQRDVVCPWCWEAGRR